MYAYLVLGIVFCLTGLVMLFAPQGFIGAVVVSLGVATFASGLYSLLVFRNAIDDPLYRRVLTVRALLGMTVGAVAVIMPIAVAGTVWLALSYLVAGYLLLSAAVCLYGAFRLRQAGLTVTSYFYEAGASIACSLILIAFPGTTGSLMVRVTGALVLAGGIAVSLWAIGLFGNGPNGKKPVDTSQEK